MRKATKILVAVMAATGCVTVAALWTAWSRIPEAHARSCLRNVEQLADRALAEAIPEIVLKTGFLEGPIYRKVKSKRLQPDQATGKMRLVVEDRIIAEYERVSPLDIYPAPDSNGIDDGSLIKKTAYNGTALTEWPAVVGGKAIVPTAKLLSGAQAEPLQRMT
jgi:hypothetical protein